MTDRLDLVFHALSDPTRRAILARLMAGPASVSELAAPLEIGLPTLMAHLDRLERAGLVRSSKRGRVRSYRANPVALAPALRWIGGRHADWHARAEALPARLREPAS
jgi:DNA-binding transcriptional ArsR family regulator